MVIWEETKLKPKIETAHIVGEAENVCESCEKWGEACETCNVSIPISCEYSFEKVKMAQDTICGIPVGDPFELSEG